VAVGSGGGVVALVLRLCTAPGAETSSDQRATRLEHDIGNAGRGGGASAEALYGSRSRDVIVSESNAPGARRRQRRAGWWR
jgi:hypothetical protein